MEAEGLLAATNVCGQTLLKLVASGSAVLAEILRLADVIPSVFEGTGESFARYEHVVFDFAYFKKRSSMEERIDNDEDLLMKDHELQLRFAKLIDRFYLAFRAIVRYHRKLTMFWDDLENGFYIQHSAEEILMDRDGAQLMCEALYQYGVMLVLLEQKIPSRVRERMVVFSLRTRGEAVLKDLETVSVLAGSDDFARLNVDTRITKLILSKLELDDLYTMRRAYPNPDHRTTALSQQAAMLFVVLKFCPETLRNERATMRAIVDRFFTDNWVLHLYMGTIVNLHDAWNSFPAARQALLEVQGRPKDLGVAEVQTHIDKHLMDGVLTDKFVLEHSTKLISLVTRSNVIIRWLMLHRTDRRSAITAEGLLELILGTAQLEAILKDKLRKLKAKRHETWSYCQAQASKRMGELSDYFTGTVSLTRVKPNETLVAWFKMIQGEIDSLEYVTPTITGRRIQKLLLALREADSIEEIDTSLHIKQFLIDSREVLLQMVRVVSLNDSLLANLDIVTDMAYAWELIADYMSLLHARIHQQPGSIKLLRATFIKLVSILDTPLIRISQADSPDAPQVAAYYSGELVKFVQRVLAVIPQSMFDVLMQLMDLLVHRLPSIPSKVEIDNLRALDCQRERLRITELSHWISTFTEGMLTMQETLLGVIKVDPHQLLEDGIRTELVSRVCHALDRQVQLPTPLINPSTEQVLKVLHNVSASMRSFERSLEYVQDYVAINGLRMWHEELERIFECYAEYEMYRRPPAIGNKGIPILRDARGQTFLGRLGLILDELTRPGWTVYAPEQASWHELSTYQEVLGTNMMRALKEAVGVKGLHALDRVLEVRITRELRSFFRRASVFSSSNTALLKAPPKQLIMALGQPCLGSCEPEELLSLLKEWRDGAQQASQTIGSLMDLGRWQLLRLRLQHELRHTARVESSLFSTVVSRTNQSLLQRAVAAGLAECANEEDDAVATSMAAELIELDPLLDRCGLGEPLKKIYLDNSFIADECASVIPSLLLVALVEAFPRVRYDSTFATLVPSTKPILPLDGSPLAVGLTTVLRQLERVEMDAFVTGFGSFTRASIKEELSGRIGTKGLPDPILSAIHFAETFFEVADVDLVDVSRAFPVSCFAYIDLLSAPRSRQGVSS